MFRNFRLFKLLVHCIIVLFLLTNTKLLACDTTPSLSVSNVIDNGDGTYYMDITACIGSSGSADGFDLYFNNDINIIGTTVTEVTATGTGNVASVSVSNGIWLAFFDQYDPVTNTPYFENGAWGLDCIEFGVIVDDNPEGATLCSVGINEDCLGFTQQEVFITCGVIPGPCLPNYFLTDNGTIDSSVLPAGQNCNFAPFNDEIIELTVTCDGNFNFSLTQDQSISWPGESWLTIAVGCCSGVIEQTSSFGFIDPTITIDTYLTEGTYYIIVDIEGNGFPGDYILDVTSDADLTLVSEANAGEDQLTCEDFTNLDGNTGIDNSELGTWTLISGNGTFTDPSDPTTTVTNLSDGNNIFQWEISNECASSSDQVTIEVANNINLNIPEIVYCLEEIPLSVLGGGNNGEWSVEPDFNIEIDDINSNNTFATVNAYGTYIFTYTICDEDFSQEVNVESNAPTLSSNADTYYCLEEFQLIAEVDGDPGYWDFQGPYIADFNNITSLTPIINVDGYGTYVFTYYGCGTSTDITINMSGIEPTVEGPEETYCLDSFELSANVEGDPGYWSFEGPGNAIFDNQNSTNTSVSIDTYGTYIFNYNGCGSTSEYILVNSLELMPQILNPIDNYTIYCDLEIDLEAYVLGDPGYWDFEGPGNANFNNLNSLNTTVNVDQYGTYEFTYYGCGESSESVTVNFNTSDPEILTETNIYCELNTSLNAQINGDENVQWFLNNGPENANVSFSNSTELNSEMTVSEYGLYEVGITACGITSFAEISFEPLAPHIIANNFQNCILTATLLAYTDDPNGGGPWSQTGGPEGAIFSDPNSHITEVTVPMFGLYNFSYQGCDTISNINIGFECPLIIPNTLTPNGDGNNDFFIINNLNPSIYSESLFTVYNRWGVIVFTSPQYGLNNDFWDGKTTYNNEPVTDGVYFYVLEVFNNAKQQKEEYTGEINIFISNSSSSNDE
jgi:gliding motility-associated-like protein